MQYITVTATGSTTICTSQDSLTTGNDTYSCWFAGGGGNYMLSQSFQASSSYSLDAVTLALYGTGTPTSLIVEAYNEVGGFPSGAAISTGVYDVTGILPPIVIPSDLTWITVPMTSADIISGNHYDIVLSSPDGVFGDMPPLCDGIYWAATTTDGPGLLGYSINAGAGWNYCSDISVASDGLYIVHGCDYPDPPTAFHITSITATSITLAWQESGAAEAYRLLYSTIGYPAAPTDNTLAYHGSITSNTVTGLTAGLTYYFSLWSYALGVYSVNASYCAATVSAGYDNPDYGSNVDDDTDTSILDASIAGGLIDFMYQYSQLPRKGIGLLGFGALLLFVLMGVASYTRSVAMTVLFGTVGLLLGNSLGVLALIFCVIAGIGGIAIGTLRGGQPN